MSWIESHQSLLTHRKTLRAMALLKIDKFKLIGHLHALWWWGIDNADDDGGLGDVGPEEVAVAAEWPLKKAASFTAALVTAGFLEENGDAYVLHNWYRYAGKLNAQREANRERMRVARAAHVHLLPTNPPTEPTVPTNQPTFGGGGRRNIFALYESVFGPMHGGVVEELKAVEDEYPPACVEHCFQAAKDLVPRPRSLAWVKSMLSRHQREGCDTRAPQKVAEPALKGRYD